MYLKKLKLYKCSFDDVNAYLWDNAHFIFASTTIQNEMTLKNWNGYTAFSGHKLFINMHWCRYIYYVKKHVHCILNYWYYCIFLHFYMYCSYCQKITIKFMKILYFNVYKNLHIICSWISVPQRTYIACFFV